MRTLVPVETLLDALTARQSAAEVRAVATLAALAARRGAAVYLVGGSVRDLLLGRAHVDLDLVVEADAPALARAAGRALKARVTVHTAFGTAEVAGADFRFDLVTARRETYPAPGALPVVTPATLADDLARRDFTVNAMALALSGPAAGALVDPHGGRADLAAGVLRVLHPRSFQDDATRLWRAGRYAARLDLRPDAATAALIARDRRFLATISPARVYHELTRVLDEETPERSLHLLGRWGVLRATHPALRVPAARARAFPRLRRLQPERPRAAALALLMLGRTAAEIESLIARLEPERAERAALRALPRLETTLAALLARGASPGTIAPALDRVPEAALAAIAAGRPRRPDGRIARAYLTAWRHVRPALTPARLMALGVPRGPRLGALLRLLRAARLDGRVRSLDDEERLVHTEIARAGPGDGTPAAHHGPRRSRR
jgi:tRNA nucleotidyltransferase (CCA-adding enzyme)